ncbi:MAG: zf-HC2 domain-containing protein [Actinomycetes bacterium]
MSEEQMTEIDVACRDLVEMVTDYLEDVLDPRTAAAVEHHLSLCPGCVDYAEQMRTTIKLVGHVPAESLSPKARAELVAAFRDFHADGRAT